MPRDALEEHLVGLLEGVEDGDVAVGDREQPVVGDHDEGVDLLAEVGDALLGGAGAAAALEGERPGDDADGQRAERAGDARDDGRAAGAGAAALAGGDEDHVGALEDLLDLVGVVLGGLLADLGVGAGAEAAGELAADVELDVGVAHEQGLGVGVDRDELDALEADLDHPVDGVDAAAADAHDLDDREVVLRCCHGFAPVSTGDARLAGLNCHPQAEGYSYVNLSVPMTVGTRGVRVVATRGTTSTRPQTFAGSAGQGLWWCGLDGHADVVDLAPGRWRAARRAPRPWCRTRPRSPSTPSRPSLSTSEIWSTRRDLDVVDEEAQLLGQRRDHLGGLLERGRGRCRSRSRRGAARAAPSCSRGRRRRRRPCRAAGRRSRPPRSATRSSIEIRTPCGHCRVTDDRPAPRRARRSGARRAARSTRDQRLALVDAGAGPDVGGRRRSGRR